MDMAVNAPTTRRRRFQFGLGTMLALMTLLALWLGWEKHYIQERRDFLELNKAAIAAGPKRYVMSRRVPPKPAEIPFWRRWLGDEPVDVISMPFAAGKEAHAKAMALFPEARLE
jgi:hypothetical protein